MIFFYFFICSSMQAQVYNIKVTNHLEKEPTLPPSMMLDALIHFKLVLDVVFLLQLLWNSWKPVDATKRFIDSIRPAQNPQLSQYQN